MLPGDREIQAAISEAMTTYSKV